MVNASDQNEHHTLRGATDRPALLTIRDVIEEMEPLATAELDDYLHPSVLEVALDDGLCTADAARIDVQWTTQAHYKFHYTDTEAVNFRWGKHPHADDYLNVPGLEHYHPPPTASSKPDEVEESCIKQAPEVLVTRAVLKLWRVAYHMDSYDPLNTGRNPP
ncbi:MULTISPECIES: hypothetical protein [Halorubrum]|uniref:Uncharacterized protein n=1 Tax=Halorubrum halodurans TaxID=1383851 RepID=A0A256IJ93_9EURY|nr:MULTISPECIES: hypothetical protein [Halorubrum]MDB9252948.1 hypothetical protein [Halorubrum ezzemoulense]MDB9256667.1 hypothetical protein [Halorubrum ezzemoulense]MDB9278074.1 hypothetical protein [Halorubrum ezzemoulense]OYR56600.1 hypothetical protein DJ70_08165 [Halorubrum halodurans]